MDYSRLYLKAQNLADIPLSQWEEFTSSFQVKRFKKSDILLSPGLEAQEFFIMISGIARNYDIDEKGKEFTKVFRSPGEIIGPYAEVLAATRTRFFIQAITNCEVISFPYSAFQKMMDHYPQWQKLGRLIAEQNYLEKEKREYELLHYSAEKRYTEFLHQYGELALEIPQYHVASLLGISPEALNRIIKKSLNSLRT
jgi:CRP-like cAMP-binding protein